MERVGGWRVFTFLVLVQLVKLQPTEIRVGTALSLNLCAKWEEAVWVQIPPWASLATYLWESYLF